MRSPRRPVTSFLAGVGGVLRCGPKCSEWKRYYSAFRIIPLSIIAAGRAFEPGYAQTLELIEQRAIALPERVTVTQAELGDRGSILVWGPADAWMVREGALEPLCDSPVRNALAGHMTAEDQVEMVLGSPGHGLLSSTPEGCRFTSFASRAPVLRAAAYAGGARLGVDDRGRILEIAFDGSIRAIDHHSMTVTQLAQAASDTLPVWMAPTSSGFIIGMRAPPFVWLHASLGDEEVVVNPLQSDFVRSIGAGVSTGVVQVDDHFVQVIADLQSTTRRLLLFGEDGELVREKRIEVPFGVLDVNTQTQTMLVLRRSDHLEVVVYEYSWRDVP